jgi:hypothetical protein
MCLDIYQLGKVVTAWDNKITLIPRPIYDIVFYGLLYFFDQVWRIRSCSLAGSISVIMETGFLSGIYVWNKSRRVV